ncbi:unnamed protein product [Moneuplotes crassus]|uniref:Histone deacetylase complex subunit SAP30 Sin3 binding domain-containing protein n=1 Tax=Euplotes crassus TaxID=5936 RepID=A0AAD1Y3F9_EUPCR|nr:unnamed protein product [Moneuplotes crassus]
MEKSPEKSQTAPKKKYPLDFGKLTLGSLRRYQAKFKLEGDLKDKDRLIEAVSEHFFNTKMDCNRVIRKFLQIKKDERQDDSHYLRKSVRNKEKLERNQQARNEKYNIYVASKPKPTLQ